MKTLSIVLFVVSCAILSCDHGLAPPPKEKIEQGITGTIYYKGTFPDSLKEHRLFAAKMDRKFRSMNEIMMLILSGSDSIQIYPSILQSPLSLIKEDSIKFRFVLPPALYKYIAVAQTTGAIFDSSKWKIVGVYSSDSMRITSDEIFVEPGKFLENVNIYVNYDSLPPQPFGITGRER
ncbi:MAG: hypothetical protein QME58_05470 [Bacteroidota bacterium]|nr:hypothetical protein [Bacteroidota bacterium]